MISSGWSSDSILKAPPGKDFLDKEKVPSEGIL